MIDFLQYVLGEGETQEFSMLSPSHFLPILVAVAVIVVTYYARNRLRVSKHEYMWRYAMAFLLIISEMAYYWRLVALPSLEPNPVEHLPIAVCGWAAIFGSYMVIGKSQTLFEIVYFWALAGSVFAIATPTVLTFVGPTRFRYYQFWIEHLMSFVAVFYMIFVHRMRPTVKGMFKSYGALVVLAVVAYAANTLIGNGANYLFMARPEAAPSILDILPSNFALRLGIMATAIAALFALAYWPWQAIDRKAAKNERRLENA